MKAVSLASNPIEVDFINRRLRAGTFTF